MTSTRRIGVLLALIAEQCGETITEARLEFMLSRLEGLDARKLEQALESLAESSRRFPTIAEIKAAMGQSDATARDKALVIADRILAGVAKIGEIPPGGVTIGESVRHVVGETAFEVVQAMGGWNRVVAMAGEGQNILRAQIRDYAEAGYRTGRFERDPSGERLLPPHEAVEMARVEARARERAEIEAELTTLRLVAADRDARVAEERKRVEQDIRSLFLQRTGIVDHDSEIPAHATLDTAQKRIDLLQRHGMLVQVRRVSDLWNASLVNEAVRLDIQNPTFGRNETFDSTKQTSTMTNDRDQRRAVGRPDAKTHQRGDSR